MRTLLVAGAALVALGGCSLLVDTRGLSGGSDSPAPPGADGAVDGATPDGDGGSSSGGIPPSVDGGTHVVSLLSAGGEHTCAVVDGTMYCWGLNDHGQLGDGTKANAFAPHPVVGLPSGTITAISAGDEHTCAVVAGKIWCWGTTNNGALGPGVNGDSPTPLAVAGIPTTTATDVAAGYEFTCAVIGGEPWCWGRNTIGQLGQGTTSPSAAPAAVQFTTASTPAATHVSAGNDHACAVTAGGDMACWGHSDNGVLGNPGAGGSSSKAVPVQALPNGVATGIIAGWHACALEGTGAMWCWGTGDAGELGNGSKLSSAQPVQPIGLDANVTAIVPAGGATDGDATCVVKSGAVLCWGNAEHGRLGDGTTAARATPGPVPLLASGATKVAGGFDHFCAVAGDAIACWGKGTSGQLGDDKGHDSPTPVVVTGFSR